MVTPFIDGHSNSCWCPQRSWAGASIHTHIYGGILAVLWCNQIIIILFCLWVCTFPYTVYVSVLHALSLILVAWYVLGCTRYIAHHVRAYIRQSLQKDRELKCLLQTHCTLYSLDWSSSFVASELEVMGEVLQNLIGSLQISNLSLIIDAVVAI